MSRSHPTFAWFYEVLSRPGDRRGNDPMRSRLTRGLSGRVLEVGVGNGLNFSYYQPGVSVVAIEPDPHMLRRAVPRAERAAIPVSLVEADGQALPFSSRSFDAAVVSLVLCTIPDPLAALTELSRVLKPGAQVHFVEHVRADGPILGSLQDVIDPLWSRAFAGCHPNRRTAELFEVAGFKFEKIRSRLRGVMIRGRATLA